MIDPNTFFQRSPDEQEIILLNVQCDHCRQAAKAPTDPVEEQRNGETFVTVTCSRCGNRASVNLRDIP